MNDITPEERMMVWKEMAKSQPKGFTWESFKRTLQAETMLGAQVRHGAKRILKKIRESS